MSLLRVCKYKNNIYYFHKWFQEGYREGGDGDAHIDIGAIIENKENGKIIKVFDVEKIAFEK